MGKDAAFAQTALNCIIGAQAANKPATVYVGLFTALPDSSGYAGSEPSGNGYARAAYTNDGTLWAYTAPNQMKNVAQVQVSGASGSGWGTIVGFGVFQNPTGPCMWYGAVATPQIIVAGDVAIFTAGTLVVTED